MIGLVLAVNTIVIVAVEMVLVHAIQDRNPLLVLGVSGVFVGIGFGILPFGAGVPFVVFTVLLWTVGEMLGAPVLQTWVSHRAPTANQGRYMAAFGLCFSLASIVAPPRGNRDLPERRTRRRLVRVPGDRRDPDPRLPLAGAEGFQGRGSQGIVMVTIPWSCLPSVSVTSRRNATSVGRPQSR